MTNAPGDEDAYKLAFEISLRNMESQSAAFSLVRQRASSLVVTALGAGGVIATIIFTSPKSGEVTKLGFAGLALAGLAGFAVLLSTIYIWYPTKRWHFTISIRQMVEDIDNGTESAEIHRTLAKRLQGDAEENNDKLKKRMRAFNAGLWAVLLEVAALAMLIGDVANA